MHDESEDSEDSVYIPQANTAGEAEEEYKSDQTDSNNLTSKVSARKGVKTENAELHVIEVGSLLRKRKGRDLIFTKEVENQRKEEEKRDKEVREMREQWIREQEVKEDARDEAWELRRKEKERKEQSSSSSGYFVPSQPENKKNKVPETERNDNLISERSSVENTPSPKRRDESEAQQVPASPARRRDEEPVPVNSGGRNNDEVLYSVKGDTSDPGKVSEVVNFSKNSASSGGAMDVTVLGEEAVTNILNTSDVNKGIHSASARENSAGSGGEEEDILMME